MSGLKTFFKSFLKKNPKIYTEVYSKLSKRQPGQRLWENDDIRIDRGEDIPKTTLTNIVWQRQKQTKQPALKKITDTHSKIHTQTLDRTNPPDEEALKDDLMDTF